MKFETAPDVNAMAEEILPYLDFPHINTYRLIYMRSRGSKARAYARIWSMPKIWQEALEIKAYYVIEVLSEYFDKLDDEKKQKILIHELLHIPKTFSGGLVPHTCFGQRINEKRVGEIYERMMEKKRNSEVPE
ncbi:MAG: putative metallopeptidase [Candidatus Micrarchaeota archaeon]